MTRALLFHCEGDDDGQVQLALRAAVQGVDASIDFRVWPDVGNRNDVRYAAIWNPPNELFDDLSQLQTVFALSAGVDRLLANPALPDTIPVVRLEDAGMAEAMAEYVLYGVLHAHRRFPAFGDAQRSQRWDSRITARSADQFRVGILGAGVLGAHAATRLHANGYDVTCWSRRDRELPSGIKHCKGTEALKTMARSSDVLVCLLPSTPSTEGILNASLFDAMPVGAFLINAARGAHLIESDLLVAVQSGQLAGALLDVMQQEPPEQQHPFWAEPRIVMTPHVAAPTPAEGAATQVSRALSAILEGRRPPGLVDRESGY